MAQGSDLCVPGSGVVFVLMDSSKQRKLAGGVCK